MLDNTDQQPTNHSIKRKSFLGRLFSVKLIRIITNFFYKFRKAFVAIVIIATVFIAMFSFIPVISFKNTKLVNSNTSVRLEVGQTVYLKNRKTSVTIASFVSDVCAIPGTCFGNINEKDVEYMVKIDGADYVVSSAVRTTIDGTPKYKIETESSDYKTYAIIKIVKK